MDDATDIEEWDARRVIGRLRGGLGKTREDKAVAGFRVLRVVGIVVYS